MARSARRGASLQIYRKVRGFRTFKAPKGRKPSDQRIVHPAPPADTDAR